MLNLIASLCQKFMYDTQKVLTANSRSVNQPALLVQETGCMHLFLDSLMSLNHETYRV